MSLLVCHYPQTANGAVVSTQQSVFNSKLFSLRANSPTSSVLLLIVDCQGEWATEQQANDTW